MNEHASSVHEETVADRATDAVSENPALAAGMAVAAGVVVGLLAAGMLAETRRPRSKTDQLQDFFAGVKNSVEDSVRSALRA